jgi:hypothetical protein
MRFAAAALVLAATLVPASAWAATPAPVPSGLLMHRSPAGTFTNPGGHHASPKPMNGQGCIANHPNAAQVATNPITGKPQAQSIVQIPIGGGNSADATARAQQAHACAHYRT